MSWAGLFATDKSWFSFKEMSIHSDRVKQKTLLLHSKNCAAATQGCMTQNYMRQRHSQTTNSEDRSKPCEYPAGCKVNMQKISQHKLMPMNDTLKATLESSSDNLSIWRHYLYPGHHLELKKDTVVRNTFDRLFVKNM